MACNLLDASQNDKYPFVKNCLSGLYVLVQGLSVLNDHKIGTRRPAICEGPHITIHVQSPCCMPVPIRSGA